MANQPNEDFSESELKGASPEMSPALAWAAERFEFDPGLLEPQPGVETLQKWLLSQDVTVALDAMLGPQTLTALERAFAADEGSAVAKERLGIKDDDATVQQAPGPEPTPPPGSDAVSARPVALSDSAISDVSQDRLGFTPYVEAVAEFILAEQTRPPLAIAINAAWGQGKTSFMNMLDGQLKRAAAGTTTRVATTWFNPWKYSEPEQVWGAFVANVTRCLRANLTREQSWRFRWDRFREKWRRHADFAFVLRLLVAAAFLVMVLGLFFTMKWTEFSGVFAGEKNIASALYKAVTETDLGGWWYVLVGPFMLLILLYGYTALTKSLGLNLLEYVEKTDFKDKIGTLSQFEHEMARLADAVPEDLKVVVFIDDLDRCNGKVLGEIIEALQLADVSRTCIFVMGMDLQIVANAIETDRPELAGSAGRVASMEHGGGYKFLEKIIQARLTLPTHGAAQMEGLVTSAMTRDDDHADEAAQGAAAAAPGQATGASRKQGLVGRVGQSIGLLAPERREAPSDSQAVIATAKHYGSRHFANPRRLKRFINGFRLQTYLTAAARPQATPIDRLARFLVLAEKWPAIVDYMLDREIGTKEVLEQSAITIGVPMSKQIEQLPKDDRERVYELLLGPGGDDPLSAAEWKDLADWYGFGHYSTANGG
jgi:hypothetical protein